MVVLFQYLLSVFAIEKIFFTGYSEVFKKTGCNRIVKNDDWFIFVTRRLKIGNGCREKLIISIEFKQNNWN
jgi:hypothetical protein